MGSCKADNSCRRTSLSNDKQINKTFIVPYYITQQHNSHWFFIFRTLIFGPAVYNADMRSSPAYSDSAFFS